LLLLPFRCDEDVAWPWVGEKAPARLGFEPDSLTSGVFCFVLCFPGGFFLGRLILSRPLRTKVCDGSTLAVRGLVFFRSFPRLQGRGERDVPSGRS